MKIKSNLSHNFLTIYGEARGEPYNGMVAVGAVVFCPIWIKTEFYIYIYINIRVFLGMYNAKN